MLLPFSNHHSINWQQRSGVVKERSQRALCIPCKLSITEYGPVCTMYTMLYEYTRNGCEAASHARWRTMLRYRHLVTHTVCFKHTSGNHGQAGNSNILRKYLSLTAILTPWSRVLQKQPNAQLLKHFPTRRLITVFTRAFQWCLSLARRIILWLY
jgi:hypothetical protein